MRAIGQPGKPARALEISAGIAGRRFGLCGFSARESERIAKVLGGIDSLAMSFDERLLGETAQVCDAIVVKLEGISPAGLRAAAASTAPILLTGPGESLLEGVSAAYSWPHDLLCEPWTEAELVVRLFRLLRPSNGLRESAARGSKLEPLVLLADDDPEMIALIVATLRNDGIACRTAEDGLAALQLARQLVPDIMILDVKMPRMDGFDVLETIRCDPAIETVPVILLTGCSDPTDIVRGSELRADEYLAKPVSPNILLNRVKRLLASQGNAARRWDRPLPGMTSGRRTARQWTLSAQPRAVEQR